MKQKSTGFTLIEILIALSLTAAIFIIATSLVVNVFSTNTKSKQVEVLSQVKNDLQSEFSNSVRWADNISSAGGALQIDSTVYILENGVIMKNGEAITPGEVEITQFEIKKHEASVSKTPTLNSGIGLTGQYFNAAGFVELAFIQDDFVVNFDWGEGSPDPLIDPNTFSIRYIGQIEAPINSTYTFYVHSDDGARLWVDNTQVLDDWNGLGYGERASVPIRLDGGRKYNILLEYYENTGPAALSLYWSYFGVAKQIIPTTRLYPNENNGSIEVIIKAHHRTSSSIVDTINLVLSPRNGNIGVIE